MIVAGSAVCHAVKEEGERNVRPLRYDVSVLSVLSGEESAGGHDVFAP